MSQAAYNYKMLALHMKYKTPYKISKTSYWYVEKVKQDSDTGLDAFVFSKGIKSKNGKWIKSKNPENVVVAFAGTDIGKDPISDCWNIVFGNDPQKEVYYKEKNKNGYSLRKGIYPLEFLGPANTKIKTPVRRLKIFLPHPQRSSLFCHLEDHINRQIRLVLHYSNITKL
ncbi:hypothetical protein P4484_09715 [Bacillus velezensis]|nr:hypothetical protein [Bacillus sp. UNC69MF]MED3702095.1 hypothetical protein [Bacillus velezensis]